MSFDSKVFHLSYSFKKVSSENEQNPYGCEKHAKADPSSVQVDTAHLHVIYSIGLPYQNL